MRAFKNDEGPSWTEMVFPQEVVSASQTLKWEFMYARSLSTWVRLDLVCWDGVWLPSLPSGLLSENQSPRLLGSPQVPFRSGPKCRLPKDLKATSKPSWWGGPAFTPILIITCWLSPWRGRFVYIPWHCDTLLDYFETIFWIPSWSI